MISFHLQTSVPDWLSAVEKLPPGTPLKAVNNAQFLREAKQRNPGVITIHREWYDHGQHFDNSPYTVLLSRARTFFQSFINPTFRELSPYIDVVETWNETIAQSQTATEKKWRVDQERAMCEVWAADYAAAFPHMRLCLANTAVGNDVPLGFAQLADQYGHYIGYHGYVAVFNSNSISFSVNELESADNRASFRDGGLYLIPDADTITSFSPGAAGPVYGEFEWASGRWTVMDAAYRSADYEVKWLITEGGPVRSVNGGGALDPQGGWRHGGVCGGDVGCYVEIMRYWATRVAAWNAQHNNRCQGVTMFTTGGGSTWEWFETRQPEMNALADLARQFPPGGGDPPDPPQPPGELINGNFDTPWAGSHNVIKITPGGLVATQRGENFSPPGWTVWMRHDGTYSEPESHDTAATNPNRFVSGKGYQLFTFSRRHDCGVLQQISLPSGTRVSFTAKFHAWSAHCDQTCCVCCDNPRCSEGAGQSPFYAEVGTVAPGPQHDNQINFTAMVGIDPLGGLDPFAPSVVWGKGAHVYNAFRQLPPVSVAVGQGGRITVFLREETRWAFKHNDGYWDDAVLTVGETPPPGTLCNIPVNRRRQILRPQTLSTAQEYQLSLWQRDGIPAILLDKSGANVPVGVAGYSHEDMILAILNAISQQPESMLIVVDGDQIGTGLTPAWLGNYCPTVAATAKFINTFRLSRWPVPSRVINQRFGVNSDDYAQFGYPGHSGVDMAGVIGDPIVAMVEGRVDQVGYDPTGFGHYVWIATTHNEEVYRIVYAHMNTIPFVSVGDAVAPGQRIGSVGSSGNSTGSHLHVEMRIPSRNYKQRSGVSWPRNVHDISMWLSAIEPGLF